MKVGERAPQQQVGSFGSAAGQEDDILEGV